jgi:hypothetical protein
MVSSKLAEIVNNAVFKRPSKAREWNKTMIFDNYIPTDYFYELVALHNVIMSESGQPQWFIDFLITIIGPYGLRLTGRRGNLRPLQPHVFYMDQVFCFLPKIIKFLKANFSFREYVQALHNSNNMWRVCVSTIGSYPLTNDWDKGYSRIPILRSLWDKSTGYNPKVFVRVNDYTAEAFELFDLMLTLRDSNQEWNLNDVRVAQKFSSFRGKEAFTKEFRNVNLTNDSINRGIYLDFSYEEKEILVGLVPFCNGMYTGQRIIERKFQRRLNRAPPQDDLLTDQIKFELKGFTGAELRESKIKDSLFYLYCVSSFINSVKMQRIYRSRYKPESMHFGKIGGANQCVKRYQKRNSRISSITGRYRR